MEITRLHDVKHIWNIYIYLFLSCNGLHSQKKKKKHWDFLGKTNRMVTPKQVRSVSVSVIFSQLIQTKLEGACNPTDPYGIHLALTCLTSCIKSAKALTRNPDPNPKMRSSHLDPRLWTPIFELGPYNFKPKPHSEILQVGTSCEAISWAREAKQKKEVGCWGACALRIWAEKWVSGIHV